MTTPKKLIPKFSTPIEQTREIDGQPVTVRRLPARRAPDVLSRLLTDVGSFIVEMLSSPDKELDPAIEGFVRSMVAAKTDAEKSVDMTISIVKAILFSDAIGKIKGFNFTWYVEQMLPGCMSIGDVAIDKMEELDESGISPRTLFEVFRFACEVNFFPTSAGSDTGDGSPELIQNQQTLPASQESLLRGTSSLRGDRRKDGPGAQMSEAMI